MTYNAEVCRSFRHRNEAAVMLKFSQTRAGQFATVPQVKAAARQVLMRATSAIRKLELANSAATA